MNYLIVLLKKIFTVFELVFCTKNYLETKRKKLHQELEKYDIGSSMDCSAEELSLKRKIMVIDNFLGEMTD